MLRRTSAVLMLAYGLLAAAAHGQDLQAALTSQYHDKLLALRHSFTPGIQEYAADGTPSRAYEEGSWTVYGRMMVDKIYFDEAQLTVEGKRATYSFDRAGNLVKFQDDGKHPADLIKVTLHLQESISSTEAAAVVLGRVFALTPEDMVHSVPELWQGELASQLGIHELKTRGARGENETDSKIENPPNLGTLNKKNVSPPAVVYEPEPRYTDAARSRGLQGVVGLNIVVDKTGAVRNIHIVHPLGMGLDENAVATVSTWRFTPAKVSGQPVAVAIYLEVDFRLR